VNPIPNLKLSEDKLEKARAALKSLVEKMKNPDVSFRTKSEFQKDDCLFCDNEAVLEAVFGSANIRCCSMKSCRDSAADLARQLGSISVPKVCVTQEAFDFLIDADCSKAERIDELCKEIEEARLILGGKKLTVQEAMDHMNNGTHAPTLVELAKRVAEVERQYEAACMDQKVVKVWLNSTCWCVGITLNPHITYITFDSYEDAIDHAIWLASVNNCNVQTAGDL
jgi:hypothetical protein